MIFFEVAFMSCCGENQCIACNDDKEDINSKKEHLENQNLLKSSTVSFMLRHSSATGVLINNIS